MRLTITKDIIGQFPSLTIARLDATGVDNGEVDGRDALDQELAAATEQFRTRFATEAALTEHPLLVLWRETYTKFGINPKRQRPSAEALLRRVLKSGAVPRINPIVDIYLLSELHHLLPVGGYDRDCVRGPLQLRHSAGAEPFDAIGSTTPEPTVKGEIVYSDDDGVLTRCWNWRDCDRTKITEQTKNLSLFIELPNAAQGTAILQAQIDFIAQRVERYCKGRVETHVLSANELAG